MRATTFGTTANSSLRSAADKMPIYEYTCRACGNDFELLVRSSTVLACPKCESQELDRKLSLPAIKFATSVSGRWPM